MKATSTGRFASSTPEIVRPVFICCAAMLLVGNAFAQGTVLSHGESVSIRSEILDENRTFRVWTPPDYQHTGLAYPVLYVLDGDVHFHHAVASVQFSARYIRVPEMIVVAIDHPNRSRDLVPVPDTTHGSDGSMIVGPPGFLRFLTEELLPFVESTYRTEPFDILFGHSLGGLFAVSAFVEAPDAFEATLAVSPSLYWRDRLVVAQTADVLGEVSPHNRFLYLALGGAEPPNIARSTGALRTALNKGAPDWLRWSWAEFENENHLTVPYDAMHHGLRAIFGDWVSGLGGTTESLRAAGTVEPLVSRARDVADLYGYAIREPEFLLATLASRLAGDNPALGLELMRRRVATYPSSPDAYDQLAQALESAGSVAEAVRSYERAVELAREQGFAGLAEIEGRLERARGR